MIKNGAGLFVLGNDDTINFIPKCYEEYGVADEDTPRYTLRAMTVPERDKIEKASQEERQNITQDIVLNCVVNWSNKKDLKGNTIEYSYEKKKHYISDKELAEMVWQVMELSGMLRIEDVKKQVEDSPSSC